MYKIGIRVKRFILVIGDLAIYQAALLLTLYLRYGGVEYTTWNAHILPFSIVSLLWVVSSYITGLYDLSHLKNGIKFFRLYLEGMIANLAVALAFFYLLPFFNIAPRTNLFLYFAIVLLLGYGWRLAYNRFIANALFRSRLLFIGTGFEAAKIEKLLSGSILGFELVAVLETEAGPRVKENEIKWYSSLEALEDIISSEHIQTILLGSRPEATPGLRDVLYKTLFLPVTLLDRTSLEEATTGRVPLEYVTQTWFIEHLRESEKTWYESLKRVMDFVLAIPIGLVTLALFPLIALAIKLDSKGPTLISQARVGKMGKLFCIWKFRSMIDNAESLGVPQFASKEDPRITRVGKFIRAMRLDELPQIWNVLRGDMSLIGPRPERPAFVEELTRQMPYYALRHLTRPGLTGWAQVKFPYAGTLEDNLKKLQYDLFYIKHRSILIDLAIVLKTVGIVLRRQGT